MYAYTSDGKLELRANNNAYLGHEHKVKATNCAYTEPRSLYFLVNRDVIINETLEATQVESANEAIILEVGDTDVIFYNIFILW